MCLIALALEQHADFPLVIAANRDEFLQRPAAPLDWWRTGPAAAPVLGGRDLQAGGTWMGLNLRGRVAMLTNARDPTRQTPAAPSRGAIVPAWLDADEEAGAFWHRTAGRGHNPFNLLAADLHQGQWWWADDRADAPHPIGPGLYGLSNAALDTPWPKVQRLKQALADGLDGAASATDLEADLFAALADRTTPPDAALPCTGIGLERERWLAPAFIRTPDARYGTRCSTLLIVQRRRNGFGARIVERQFDAAGRAVGQRSVRLAAWPPVDGSASPVESEAFSAG